MKSEEEEVKARTELASAIRTHLPDTLINISTAGLIWLFGVLVFLPAAGRIEPELLPLACALILTIGFSVFLSRSIRGLHILLGFTSNVLAHGYARWRRTKTPIELLKDRVRCVVYVVAVSIGYMLYSPFLRAIHPSLAGLVLIPIILWIFFKLLRTIV